MASLTDPLTGRVSLEKRTEYFRTKFDSARDELLYSWTLNGCEESSGNSEAPTGWFAALHVSAEDVRDVTLNWADGDMNGMVEARETFDTLVGHFMVSTDSQGFVYVETFDTAEALAAEFDTRSLAFSRWECPWAIVDNSDGGVVDRFEDEDEAIACLMQGYDTESFSVVNTEGE